MKTSLRQRLTFSHLLVLIVGMALAGVLVWAAIESLYINTQRENLLSQARLTAWAMEGYPETNIPSQPYSQTTNVTPGIHTRLLSQSGAVIIGVPFPEGENPVQVPPALDPGYVTADELLQRPEIQSALSGEGDTHVRRIQDLEGQRVLYAAAPVVGSNNDVVSLVYMAVPLPSRGLPSDLAWKLTGSVLAGAAVASLLGILLAGGISRPLEQLVQAAIEISRGELGRRVPAQGTIRELNNLGQAFNSMSESLRMSEELKDSFIADVTHELRTPLTVLKGTVETLEDGAIDDHGYRSQLLSTMARETERLIRMVNQLLLLARSDAGALSLEIVTLDLVELVKERFAHFSLAANAKEIHLQILTKGDNLDYQALGDRNRTVQVLDNLLDNALRYAPTGSEIIIQLEAQDGLILCSIEDEGPGIPEQDLPKLFDRFFRVETARDRKSGGTGLGLSIARSLVEAQGGWITAANQDGGGARIRFSLPAIN